MSALELDQPFPFVSHDLTLGGFVGLMSGSNLAGWTIATTFEAGSEESVTQLSLGEGIATGQGLTLRQILQEFAVASGARLEISEKTRVIAFLNPAK